MNLYELTSQYNEALSVLSEIDDEALVADTLEALQGELQEKCLNVARYSENLNAESEIVDAAIKRMQARKKSLVSKRKSMNEYLLKNMQAAGITEIKCDYFVIKVGKGRENTVIENEEAIPEQFKEKVESWKVDKMAIKKAGGCAGASIIRTPTLSIK